MADYTLNTGNQPGTGVIIDGHRYHTVGVTRSFQKLVNKKRREVNRLQKEAAHAEETEDFERVDELEDQVADLLLEMIGARLATENGAEAAGVVLKTAWEEDRLELDTQLFPLMEHLYGGLGEAVPPA